ncbi:MAG: oxidoreductase [Bacteroidetes bacterium]|nr:MAG: oxidoreductase [Bacteroidota bacterium]
MHYRTLGRSRLKVSEVGFGCMSLNGTETQNIALLRKAFDSGINFFDTADLYQHGNNEVTVGKALKDIRKKVIISTKVGNQWKKDSSGWDWNPSKAYILESVERSLKRLDTDYIDLYLLHGGTIEDPIDDTIEAFEILKKSGKILYYGISSIRPNVIRTYVQKSNIVCVMMQYGLLDRRPEESCLALLRENGIGVLARGVLAKGMLVNKAAEEFLEYKKEDVSKASNAIASVSKPGRNKTQTAIRFVLNEPAISSAVIGIRTDTQLNEVLGTCSAEPLNGTEMQFLRDAVPPIFYLQHR